MTLRDFIKSNKPDIDEYVKNVIPHYGPINNKDREDFIANDEWLYEWARKAGVRL